MLRKFLDGFGLDAIACGGARGADALAWEWAHDREVPCDVFPADWKLHGKSAGPKRNQRMLETFKPDVVIAFPGGRGTGDMMWRARMAGVTVIQVDAGDRREADRG